MSKNKSQRNECLTIHTSQPNQTGFLCYNVQKTRVQNYNLKHKCKTISANIKKY